MDKRVDKFGETQEYCQFGSWRALKLVKFSCQVTTTECITVVNMLKMDVETGSEKSMDRRLLEKKKAEDPCALEMIFL